MELFLNLVWLTLAVLAIALLARSQASTPRLAGSARWQLWIALICTLIIMFFVISVTDDLHDEQIISEETQARVVITLGSQTSSGKHSGPLDLSSAVVAALIRLANPLVHTGRVEASQPVAIPLRLNIPLSGRDPPFLSPLA
jgi:hypothetical protein